MEERNCKECKHRVIANHEQWKDLKTGALDGRLIFGCELWDCKFEKKESENKE